MFETFVIFHRQCVVRMQPSRAIVSSLLLLCQYKCMRMHFLVFRFGFLSFSFLYVIFLVCSCTGGTSAKFAYV